MFDCKHYKKLKEYRYILLATQGGPGTCKILYDKILPLEIINSRRITYFLFIVRNIFFTH